MSQDPREPGFTEKTVFQPLSRAATPAAGGAGATSFFDRAAQLAQVSDDDLPDPPPRARPHNAMLEAAAPLLALAASVRAGRIEIDLRALHRGAMAAVAHFDEALHAAGYDEEVRRRARYAVCATVDDIAQNLPGKADDGAEWARRSMVVRSFGENIGGDRFWQLLNEMLGRAGEYVELIELYHACLAAGFEGRYRLGDSGGKLRAILQSAYAALPQIRSLSEVEMVPGWRGTPTPRARVGLWTPLALAASLMLAALLLTVLGLRLLLIQTGQPSMAALQSINPALPLRLSRSAAPVAIPPSGQESRVAALLSQDVANHLLVVEQDPSSLRVRTTAGTLFASGSDALAPGSAALFARIAAAVAQEKGPIRIEGHADSDPVSSLTFPDNLSLSRARAEKVAVIFRERLSDASRVSATGFGSTQPIATNATPEGKALNRRVEIVIPRSE